MPHDPRKLLYDITEGCAAIRQFCQGRKMEDYEADHMLRSACERQFEIIGEAMTRLRTIHNDVFEKVPEGSAVIAFRNRLIHGYDSVDSEIVWDVITGKIGDLEKFTRKLIEEYD